MKLTFSIFFVVFLVVSCSGGTISIQEYLPPTLEDGNNVAENPQEQTAALGKDGYEYKTVRKLRHRRRDVSELGAQSAVLSDDGYHYRVPENSEPLPLPAAEASENKEVSNEYLPPTPEIPEAVPKEADATPKISNEYLPPDDDSVIIEGPEESAVLSDDGYHYRRIRYRRDVSEINPESDGYLYSAPGSATADNENPNEENLPPADVKQVEEPATENAESKGDGYHYKTVRRIKYRNRRDVSEVLGKKSSILTKDGYHYKVPEASQLIPKVLKDYLPPNAVVKAVPETVQSPKISEQLEYLPPNADVKDVTKNIADKPEYLPPVNSLKKTTKFPEIPIKEYLPATLKEVSKPKEAEILEKTTEPVVSETTQVVTESTVSTTELSSTEPSITPAISKVSNEYLPPSEEVKPKEASQNPEESAILADDGYHYKVGKRFRLKRDVSEVMSSSNGYLYQTPAASNNVSSNNLPPAEVKEIEVALDAENSSQYIPPSVEQQNDSEITEEPRETAALANDGYQYKTVREIKYPHRRDVSEIEAPSNGYVYEKPKEKEASEPIDNSQVSGHYLPPTEEQDDDSEIIEAPKEITQVSETPEQQGFTYSAPNIPSAEYLPPEENSTGKDADETEVLAEDGYRYKTIRQIRYRYRI